MRLWLTLKPSWTLNPNSPQEEGLELFAVLIEKYQLEHYSIVESDPIKAIKFRMEQPGLTQKDGEGA